MPIEIRELVIKATASDRDADGATSGTADTISRDHDEDDLTGSIISQEDSTPGKITKSTEDGEIRMADSTHLYTLDMNGIEGESLAIDPSADTLDLDLSDADPAELEDGSVPIASFTPNFEPIRNADDADGGFVSPDLALADVEAEDYSGDTLTHEVGHWLG